MENKSFLLVVSSNSPALQIQSFNKAALNRLNNLLFDLLIAQYRSMEVFPFDGEDGEANLEEIFVLFVAMPSACCCIWND